ncbi:helix-turn-helix domain-containing protein [Marinobacter oulmenensis]|uniref:AraC family transcriptional activator of pobA n=1 Tax=Marinobacter oulmenensis TaxID=643747 RepID=A0A840UHA3_9GAMM|nr:helix-turn-helix domain-containing protein [Marinobacter oulmenensis]MBB5321725.1 AraC family transcriptional activator of pobA [Marinobacter oulmenensis]
MNAGAGISTYALYREEPSVSDPEFFHIEDIKSRARLFNWSISVHSHPRMYQLVYVRSGRVRARVDGREYDTEGPCLFTIPSSVVHGFEFERDTTLGYVITLSRVLLADDQFRGGSDVPEELRNGAQLIHLQGRESEQQFIDQTMQQLVNEYRNNEPGKQKLFEHLLFSLLIKLGRYLEVPGDPRSQDHYGKRYQQLCELIEKYYRDHRPCQYYADALCTTPIGLNRACKAVSGKSVGDLIQDRLALEAQRMLIYSSAPVSLIAYELGFSDPAYFSRFFKRRVGASPSTFRDHRENH